MKQCSTILLFDALLFLSFFFPQYSCLEDAIVLQDLSGARWSVSMGAPSPSSSSFHWPFHLFLNSSRPNYFAKKKKNRRSNFSCPGLESLLKIGLEQTKLSLRGLFSNPFYNFPLFNRLNQLIISWWRMSSLQSCVPVRVKLDESIRRMWLRPGWSGCGFAKREISLMQHHLLRVGGIIKQLKSRKRDHLYPHNARRLLIRELFVM